MCLAIIILSLIVQWGQCDKLSPKQGLNFFQEDYKSVAETCFAIRFVRKNCRNDTNMVLKTIYFFNYMYEI